MIAPVTEANAEWERGLGVPAEKIRVIPNGLKPPGEPVAAPRAARVVTVGRVDPLKDVHTMMLVADEVVRRMPEARFEYWGPVTDGQEHYGELCRRIHDELGLGDRFLFMGRTDDPHGVIRGADVVLMTSISEAMPMALLEAMAQARPVVATSVGGVPGVVRGCGIVVAPGDVHELAGAVTTLLRNPALATAMGPARLRAAAPPVHAQPLSDLLPERDRRAGRDEGGSMSPTPAPTRRRRPAPGADRPRARR